MPASWRSCLVVTLVLVSTLIKSPALLGYPRYGHLSIPQHVALQPGELLVPLGLLGFLQAFLDPEKVLRVVPHLGKVVAIQTLESTLQDLEVHRYLVILPGCHAIIPSCSPVR